jgi:hypothetical protein
MGDPRDRLLYSRSAEDLIALAREHPELVSTLVAERPLLSRVGAGRRALAEALQLEMLDLIEANEKRLSTYRAAAAAWAGRWAGLSRELEGLPLLQAHARILACARGLLPERVVT